MFYWHDWMISGNEECSHIISSYMGDKNGDKTNCISRTSPLVFRKKLCRINTMDIPDKPQQNKLSWITSNQIGLPYHRYRMYFKSYVDKYHPELFDIAARVLRVLTLSGQRWHLTNMHWRLKMLMSHTIGRKK